MTRRSPVPILLAAGLALLALAARMLVPAGFMPGTGVDGGAALVICPGQAPALAMPAGHDMAAMPMAHHDAGKGGGHDRAADHPCPFMGFAAAVDLARIAPAPIPFPVAGPVALATRLFARPGLGLAAPPPPKTGPPSFR